MQRYILGRLVQAMVGLFILGSVVFFVGRLTGDPVQLLLPPEVRREDVAILRKELGLDRPLYEQYVSYWGGIARGDLGKSLQERRPVRNILLERLPYSMKLAGLSVLIAAVMALPLGVISAVYWRSPIDRFTQVLAVLGQAIPSFWLGLLLIQVVAVTLGVLPTSGAESMAHYVLPAFTLSSFNVAALVRLLRSSLLEALRSEYTAFARSKGLSETAVIWKHALRNALIPAVTFAGIYIGLLVTSAIVVETVFAWPGIGRLVYEAVRARDYAVVQGVVLLSGALIMTANLVVDVLYAYLDPRIRPD